MMLRFALAGAVLVLAGCASVTSGSGNVVTSAAAPATPTTSVTPLAPSSPPPPTAVPSTSTSSAADAACVPGADYCDGFSSAASGWPVANSSHYFANYDEYLGGTYRMGERTPKAKTQLAPVDITTISNDYGVQVDVDAVLGRQAPASSYIGLICWDHTTTGNAEAGFFFFVTDDSVDVTLLPDSGDAPQVLDANRAGNFVRPYPATNHLTATCTQRHSAGSTVADLSLTLNGADVLHEQYAKSVKNYSWSPGSRVGLLVGGKKSDVFYDNFSVTGK